MKKILLFMIFGIGIIMIGAAGTLLSFDGNFFEGFESGNLTTNNWTLSGAGLAWSVNDGEAVPRTGIYNIRTENTNGESIIETNVDTTNYQNITFSFWGITAGLDGGEYLAADWYNGTDWITVMQVEDIVSYTEYSFNLTNDANYNPDFAIRFRCSSNSNNEACEVDDINITGEKILDITLSDFYGLNSTLGIINELNTTNLQYIEYGELNFSINSLKTIDSWYFNFSANGTNACSLGNKQSTICYSYPNWIQFVDGVETSTFDGTQGNQGDEINVIQTGSGNQVNVSLRIDEHYNPNVFKWYDAVYNFSDVKWQDGVNQRISSQESMIKMELNQSIIPINADQYKLDFRVNVTGNPEQPLEAYMCNSTYVSGHPHDYAGCAYILQLYPDNLQDDGTKFRGIFSGNSINQIGDFKYILLHTQGVNSSNYYSIKTYAATAPSYTTHWEYSNDAGTTWNNSEDGYETELNINWFYDGFEPTAFIYRFWANTTTGEEEFLEGNITWNINPTNNYPPVAHINYPSINEVLKFPYNVTFYTADTNNDNLNVSLYLYQGGSLNATLVTGMNQSNDTYLWDDLTLDGTYDLFLEACELNTTDLFCANNTNPIIVDNSIPLVNFISLTTETGSFSQNYIMANVTASDANLNKIEIYLYNSTGIVSTSQDSQNYSINLTNLFDGTYYLNATAVDDAGNINSTETRIIILDNLVPNITIISPQNITYNTTISVSLNFTLVEVNQDACFYSLNDGANISLPSCVNTTINVLQGLNSLILYANDTAGNLDSDNVTFTAIEINTCTYSSGNWEINCSDNCVIGSNIDVLGNNISITGYGNFSTTANITNFENLYIAGENSTNQCNVYCSGGGCFK